MKTFWSRLIGRGDKFFDLLEASAVEAHNSVELLLNMMKRRAATADLQNFVEIRRKDKRITEEIEEELCKTIATPMEREDIERLSVFMYKIPKTVEKFTGKLLACRNHCSDVGFCNQLDILWQSTETLVQMVKDLRRHVKLDVMKQYNEKLHSLEGDADKIMLEMVKDMYGGDHDPLKVLAVLDLRETLENAIDHCRNAGNVIFQMVLKYS